MDRQQDQPGAFRKALEELEAILETPVIPGELVSWSQAVQNAMTRAGIELRHQIDGMHAKQYETMRQENLEIERRVEQLQAEDQEILEQFERVNHKVELLLERAARDEPDEAAEEELLQAVIRQGLQFVVRARKQDTAVAVWLQEVFNRDRGDVD